MPSSGNSTLSGWVSFTRSLKVAPPRLGSPLPGPARTGASGGFYASHIPDEAGGLLDAMGEAIEIGRRSGAAVQLSHHKAMGRANWGRVCESLALLERAHEGHDVLADEYPYT